MLELAWLLYLLFSGIQGKAACDPGGSIHAYLSIIEREARKPVSPLPSCCLSACTMRLALPRACVHPGTILGFHGASDQIGRIMPSGNRVLMATYGRYPKLQAHISANGWLNSLELKHLSGRDLRAFGVPYCPKGV